MRRNLLLASRMRGDLDLGLENTRIDGASDKKWARMDFPGGRLAGQTEQTIMEESSTQKYRIGTRRVEYNRTFRYSLAGGALTSITRMVINGSFAPGSTGQEDVDGFEGGLQTEAAAGATYVDIADTTVRAVNYYQGAHLVAFSTNHYQQYHIVSSLVGTGVYVRCYLSEPVVTTITTGHGVTAYLGPYSKVMAPQSQGQEYEAFVGIAPLAITNAYYFWLQTAGPTFITPNGTYPGADVRSRDVFAWMNGCISRAAGADPSTGFQRVGYLLSTTVSAYGDAFIMMQLDN